MSDVGRQIQRVMGCTVLVPGEPGFKFLAPLVPPKSALAAGTLLLQLAFDLSLFVNPRHAANNCSALPASLPLRSFNMSHLLMVSLFMCHSYR
jgi:hypothetical protein